MSVVTGEDNVRRFPPRTGVTTSIVINLDQLEQWAKEFIADMGGDGSNDIAERLTLSSFIAWVKQNKGDDQ